MQHHNHKQLIETLLACVLECENCPTACLREEDARMVARCVGGDE